MVKKVNYESWVVLRDLLEREGIARQHLNSYNEFIERGIQSIIDEVGGIEIETLSGSYTVKFGKVKILRPRVIEIDGSVSNIYPLEARLRNLTYAAPIYVDMAIKEGGIVKEVQPQHIGDIPVMVKSELCVLHSLNEEQLIEVGEDPKDPGGYFIINGSERVIVGLEDLSPNKILVDYEKSGTSTIYKAKIYSSIIGYRAKVELTLKPDGSLTVKLPNLPVELPFVILMRSLGLKTDKEIADAVSPRPEIQELLDVSFENASEAPTPEAALMYIGNRAAPGMVDELRLKKAEAILDWGLLPHLGRTPADRYDKAMFLGEAACKVLELKLGWIDPDDKDHYGNKMIKFAGQLLADIFRTAFRNLIKDMKYQLERSGQKRGMSVIAAAIRPGIITDKLNNAIATGNWGRGRVGITQLLDRTNYLSTISHLRRIQSPLSRSQPNFEARDLHATHFGRVCPNETPEGSNSGLVKNLALSAIISLSVPASEIIDILYELGVRPIREVNSEIKEKSCKVFVDGRLIGYAEDGERLVDSFKKLRRKGRIHPHVSISIYSGKDPRAARRIYVTTSSGRVLRPLIVVENGQPLLTPEIIKRVANGELSWQDLVRMGILELIDANEEENCYIAIDPNSITPQHTHLEIYPPAILGVAASIIPYPEHNQSPRNTYESAMAKQSLGFSTPILFSSVNVREHFLVYPQMPLVTTNIIPLLNLNLRPIGQNCVVAVLPFECYNIEDAIVIN
ncbi:MAG: DNA-directed RNA polymerase subunit B'', partial [Nitrososphaerales archaeon]